MNSMSRWSSPMTPSAPYLASTRSTAASTIRRSIASSSRPEPMAMTASSSPCILSLVREHGLEPGLQLSEQVIQPELGQQAAVSRVFHEI